MNDDVIDINVQQPPPPQQRPAVDGAVDDADDVAAHNKTTRLKLITFLERYDEFPLQTRNDMDALAEDYLSKAEDKVYTMLCDNRYDGNAYRGLDSRRVTEDEVEAIVRFFPDVLSRESDNDIIDWGDGDEKYPIQFLTSMFTTTGTYRGNLKAVSFIHLLVRLAIEFGSFQDHERGGLLCEDRRGFNTLQYLIGHSSAITDGEEYNQRVDSVYLTQLIRLRQSGLLKIEDIQNHRLLHRVYNIGYFAERRCRFLIEWDPTSLLQANTEYACFPLHFTAYNSKIQGFRSIFELGIRYYPKKKDISLLFAIDNEGDTPYQLACTKFGRDEVMQVVEETFLQLQQQQQQQQQQCVSDDDDDDGNDNTNSVGPYNIIDAFITAAMDEQIHFDCVYFLLRSQPDLLKRLLLGSMTNSDNVANGTGGGGSDSNSNSNSDSSSDSHDDGDHDEINNGNVRDVDIDTRLDCKKDDNNNGNNIDNNIENHVDRKNNKNDDGNDKNPNAEVNSNTTENNRKRKGIF